MDVKAFWGVSVGQRPPVLRDLLLYGVEGDEAPDMNPRCHPELHESTYTMALKVERLLLLSGASHTAHCLSKICKRKIKQADVRQLVFVASQAICRLQAREQITAMSGHVIACISKATASSCECASGVTRCRHLRVASKLGCSLFLDGLSIKTDIMHITANLDDLEDSLHLLPKYLHRVNNQNMVGSLSS